MAVQVSYISKIFFRYYGFWYGTDGYADVGDIRYLTYRNNMILEITLAGNLVIFLHPI